LSREEEMMKKIKLFVALAFAVALSVSSVSWAGIALNADSFCNDHYLYLDKLETGVYALHGFEYGCGWNDRLLDGSLQATGGVAYIGLACIAGTSGSGDQGNLSGWNYIIDLSSDTGTFNINFFSLSGGAVNGWGYASQAATLVRGAPKPLAGESGLEPDLAFPE